MKLINFTEFFSVYFPFSESKILFFYGKFPIKISWNWFIWFHEFFWPGLFKIFLPALENAAVCYTKKNFIKKLFLLPSFLKKKYLWKKKFSVYYYNYIFLYLEYSLQRWKTTHIEKKNSKKLMLKKERIITYVKIFLNKI